MTDRESTSDLGAELQALRRRVERLEELVGAPAPPRAHPVAPPVPVPTTPPAPAVVAARSAAAASREGKGGALVVAAVGAAIFVLGAGFFLRVAIQRGWIGPAARFALGLVIGTVLAAVAARLLHRGARHLGAWVLLAGLGTLELTLWAGAFRYGFLSPRVGLAVCAGVCLVAGGLAARMAAPGALFAAFAAAYVAPVAFNERRGDVLALAAFHALLAALLVAAAYVAPRAPRWWPLRWAVLTALGLAQMAVAGLAPRADVLLCLAAFTAQVLLAVLWVWLPGHRGPDRPASATLLWIAFVLGAALLANVFWNRADLSGEAFALPLLAAAAAHGLTAPAAGRRAGEPAAEPALLVLAGVLVVGAVFVGLDQPWEAPALAAGAVALALLARGRMGVAAVAAETVDRRVVWTWMAVGFGLLAALGWMRAVGPLVASRQPALDRVAFVNPDFGAAVLTVIAGVLLLRTASTERPPTPAGVGAAGAFAWVGIEALAPSALGVELQEALRPALGAFAASTAVTVLWAVIGAAQWLRSLTRRTTEQRDDLGLGMALFAGGYFWLGVAALKLVFVDLGGIDLLWRALVFLAVGAIFLGAALYAHRRMKRPAAP